MTVATARIWIVDDQPEERAWLRGIVEQVALTAGMLTYEVREAASGSEWILVATESHCGRHDYIIADGMIGTDATGGASTVRAWLASQFGASTRGLQPRLLMISGQGVSQMRGAFSMGGYPALCAPKPEDRHDLGFRELLRKFLSGQLDPLLNSSLGVIGMFDQAPNHFRSLLIRALGAGPDQSVALGTASQDDLRDGPLRALPETLSQVFGPSWKGEPVPASDHARSAFLHHRIDVGSPGTWLAPLVAHAQRSPLSERESSLLDHMGIHIDYSWREIDEVLTRVTANATAGLFAEMLLPRTRWSVTTSGSDGGSITHRDRLWPWTDRNACLLIMLLMVQARQNVLHHAERLALNAVQNRVEVTLPQLKEVGTRLLGAAKLSELARPRASSETSGEFENVWRKRYEGHSEEFIGAFRLKSAQLINGTSFIVPLPWALSSVDF